MERIDRAGSDQERAGEHVRLIELELGARIDEAGRDCPADAHAAILLRQSGAASPVLNCFSDVVANPGAPPTLVDDAVLAA